MSSSSSAIPGFFTPREDCEVPDVPAIDEYNLLVDCAVPDPGQVDPLARIFDHPIPMPPDIPAGCYEPGVQVNATGGGTASGRYDFDNNDFCQSQLVLDINFPDPSNPASGLGYVCQTSVAVTNDSGGVKAYHAMVQFWNPEDDPDVDEPVAEARSDDVPQGWWADDVDGDPSFELQNGQSTTIRYAPFTAGSETLDDLECDKTYQYRMWVEESIVYDSSSGTYGPADSEGSMVCPCNNKKPTQLYVKITGNTADPTNDFPFKYDWEELVKSGSGIDPETGGWDGSETGLGYATNLIEERIGAPVGDDDFSTAFVPNDTPVLIIWNPAAQRWEFDSIAGVERC